MRPVSQPLEGWERGRTRVKMISLWEIKSEGLLNTRAMVWLGALVAKVWQSGISVQIFLCLREL